MKKLILPSLLFAFLISLIFSNGCTLIGLGIGSIADSNSSITPTVVIPGWGVLEELKPGTQAEFTRKDGQSIMGRYVKPVNIETNNGDTIQAIAINVLNSYRQEVIKVEDIKQVTIQGKKNRSGMLIGAGVGAVVDIAFIVALSNMDLSTSSSTSGSGNTGSSGAGGSPSDEDQEFSCPFIYSFDGGEYRLDGEIFGGAIFEAARRTDIDNLDYMAEVNGEYRLRITNELDETQYVDELKLMVIDHPMQTSVYPSFDGEMHLIIQPQAPTSAKDKKGHNILSVLKSKDEAEWVSNPFGRNPEKLEDAIDMVDLTFDKPADASSAKLLFNVRNTLWASMMQKEMLALQGDKLEAWYEELNTSEEARKALMQLMIREGMLTIKVWDGKYWYPAGFIWEVGPSISKDIIASIDIRNVQTKDLNIRVECPVGFWIVNSVQIDYLSSVPTQVLEMEAKTAIGHNGEDLLNQLINADRSYYSMPTTEYWADVTFKAPPKQAGLKRTFMLKSNGYYTIHMNPVGDRQDGVLGNIKSTKGAYGQYTLRKLNQNVEAALTQLQAQTKYNQ